jgi:phosphogluconate dehydratase
MMNMNLTLQTVTKHLILRSHISRANYLEKIHTMRANNRTQVARQNLGAANQAHGYAALGRSEKIIIREQAMPLIAIVSAYNDVLSAHQPFKDYPEQLKLSLKQAGALGQFAGGVPAMCDGVTQGRAGMELSLFSRDVIAMGTGIALSHELYDGMLLLGVCDKIVPGLLLGALAFGHLPAVFIAAGPMPSGLSNEDKANIRKQYAQGQVDDTVLLDTEMAAYHSPGTCTFYGTANSNQVLLEAMGLMLPGAAFVQPNDPLRKALTDESAKTIAHLSLSKSPIGIGEMVTAESIINAVVILLATGGSTNHTIHWLAVARAAGWQLEWADFDALSAVVPLLARVYPNGSADINDMHVAGGTAYILKELLNAGLMWRDVHTVVGQGLYHFTQTPHLSYSINLNSIDTKNNTNNTNNSNTKKITYQNTVNHSLNLDVLRPVKSPFQANGGLKLVQGLLGCAVVKTSAVALKHRCITAPCLVFESQESVHEAFKAGKLNRDLVLVVRGQGPKACGMPELHKLTPLLTVLQDSGYKVALLTDGRMSGASGKVLSAIHLTPEAGLLAHVCDGDLITIDALTGTLYIEVSLHELKARPTHVYTHAILKNTTGVGRELFSLFRRNVSPANEGATVLEF